MTHQTTWEDARLAGVTCDGMDVGTISADDEPEICSRCGKRLRLQWDVQIMEVTDG